MVKIKEDFKINSFKSGVILLIYRVNNFLYLEYGSGFLLKISLIISEFIKVLLNINAQISYKAKIGRRIRLPHVANGVVISSKAIIGNDITIYHQVTIGIKENIPIQNQFINIEDNCYISAGAKIISCTLKRNTVIGPNAVVFKDTCENQKIFASNDIR